MSRNLTDLLRAHEREARPTALARAQGGDGRARRDHRRRPPPGGRAVRPAGGDRLRHLHASTTTWSSRAAGATCRSAPARPAGRPTSAATWRRSARASGWSWASAPTTARCRSAQTVCLGFCHTAAAVRDGDVVDAGAGRGRPRAGRAVRARRTSPRARACSTSRCCSRAGRFAGLRHALAELTPGAAARARSRPPTCAAAAAPASRRAPSGSSPRAPRDPDRAIVVNGDEGDPGSYIDKQLMERNPELLLEGMALAGYAVGARRGYVLRPLRVPALDADPARGGRARARPARRASGDFDDRDRRRARARTWSARRPRCWRRCRASAARSPPARRSPPSAAATASRPWSTTSRRSATSPSSRCTERRPTRRSARARRRARSSSASTTASSGPGMYEVRFGTPVAEICEELGGGLVDGRAIKAVQIGGPLGGILPGWKLDTPFDFDELAAEGCMVGHGSILAFDDRTDMRALARHLLEFGAHESCGKCFPCRIGLQRAFEMVDRPGDLDRDAARGAARDARAGLAVRARRRHAGADPQPDRPLPGGAGRGRPGEPGRGARRPVHAPAGGAPRGRPGDAHEGRGRRPGGGGRAGRDDPRGRAGGRPLRAHALLRRPHGAVRRLPRVHGRRGGRGRAGGGLHHALPRRHAGATPRTRPRGAIAARHRRAGAVRAARAARRAHRAGRRWRASSGSASRAGRASGAGPLTTERHPYLALQHELCISCGRCVRACDEVQGAFALTATGRGFHSGITAGLDSGFVDSTCVSCGACADTCPTDAITEHSLLDLACGVH